MPQNPDAETLRLIRNRQPGGFDQAYARYAERLFGFLCRLTGHAERHLAEDLLQQTFMKLAEHGPELRPDSDLRAWLYTVARHAFLGQRRGRREIATPVLELVRDYSAEAEARLLLGDVEQALERLRVDERELLLLVSVEGLEPHVVAKMLQLDPATLRKRLERARGRLLQELERQAPSATREASS